MVDLLPFLVLGFFAYFFSAVFTMIAMDYRGKTHDIIWWPITILKFLWRTLYRALTEGWRP